MAAADKFKINVRGKGGHGANPQGTVDAIVEAAALVTALQTVVSRNKVRTSFLVPSFIFPVGNCMSIRNCRILWRVA